MNRTTACRILIALLLCLFAGSSLTRAQSISFSCATVTVKVIKTPDTVVLGCATNWPDPSTTPPPIAEVWESKEDAKTDPATWIRRFNSAVTVVQGPGRKLITLKLGAQLARDTKYIFVLKNPSTPQDQADLTVTLSTGAKGTVVPSPAQLDVGRKFVVNSDVAFTSFSSSSPPTNQGCIPSATQTGVANCTILEKREQHATTSIQQDAEIQITSLTSGSAANEPRAIGKALITLKHNNRLREEKPELTVPGLVNAFGQPVTIQNIVALSSPPKGKDDSSQFYQISHIAGRRSKPSLGINVKTNAFATFPSSFFIKDFLVQPDILIDVGTNSFEKTAADTIHLGVSATDTILNRNTGAFFQGITFGPGITYETDRKFDKSNLLGTFESHPILRSFVNTREMDRYKAVGQKCPDVQDGTCILKALDEAPQSKYKQGYGLEFFFGLEAGGSLKSQDFKSKSEKTSINIPTYSIFRFRPRIHAFYEYDRFTVDVSSALRLLATPEYVGEALDDNTVRLRRVAGFQPYNEVTLSYGLDQSKHTSISITYKRGAQPPSYPHTNTVQSGFTIKY